MHMVLPHDHAELPWSVLLGGMWIPIVYYCGLNQFIVQRTLAARSVKQAQLGAIFAGALWLLVPFAIVLPGLVADQLYGDPRAHRPGLPDAGPEAGPGGPARAHLRGAGGSGDQLVASMLNSASTILTMDLWKRYLHRRLRVQPGADRPDHVGGLPPHRRRGVAVRAARGRGLHVHPGVPGLRVAGHRRRVRLRLRVEEGAAAAGTAALLLSAPLYGLLQWQWGDVPYLHRMLATFVSRSDDGRDHPAPPLQAPRTLPVREGLDMRSSPVVVVWGALLVCAVLAFYFVFP